MKSTSAPEITSNVPNREELLQMAIRAAKAGNREGARVMFRQVLGEDRRNERAMMWMAKLASTKAERRQWLQRAVVANPDNQSAKDSLRKMAYSSKAKDNRVLVIFGVAAAFLILLALLIVFVLLPAISSH